MIIKQSYALGEFAPFFGNFRVSKKKKTRPGAPKEAGQRPHASFGAPGGVFFLKKLGNFRKMAQILQERY